MFQNFEENIGQKQFRTRENTTIKKKKEFAVRQNLIREVVHKDSIIEPNLIARSPSPKKLAT